MSVTKKKKHHRHKRERQRSGTHTQTRNEKSAPSAQILYYIDKDGKRIIIKKKRGLYYILRRMWRQRRAQRAQRRGEKCGNRAHQGGECSKVMNLIARVRGNLQRWRNALWSTFATQFTSIITRITDGAQFIWRDGIVVFFGALWRRWRQRALAIVMASLHIIASVRTLPKRFVEHAREWSDSLKALYAQRKRMRCTEECRKGNGEKKQRKDLAEDGGGDAQKEVPAQRLSWRSFLQKSVQLMRNIMRGFLWSIFDIAVLTLFAIVIIIIYVWHTIPDAATMLAPNKIAETTVIYDRTGETVLYEIHGEENRKQITHDAIPDFMRFATIAAEDDAFYNHFGIDPFSIARAVKENLLRKTLAQGGSTITQQLARNIFFTREKTLARKVREAVMALKIEQAYTKDEILDAYLNVVPYGSNAYGIEAAAEIYFGKNARDLTLDEAALLASIPKATATFSPYGTHTNRLIARQKMILERMRELSFVSGDVIDSALETDTLAKVRPFRQPIVAPHFVFHAIEELEEKYDRNFVERGGLRVYTSIDMDMQTIAQEEVVKGVDRNMRYGAENAALTAVDPRTGEILAMVGSKNYYATDIDGQVNVATRLRQPGSAFKPFAYAAAFAKGYQPETVVFDVLTNFGPDGSGKNYIPHNYTRRFHGLVSLRDALAQSLNIPAVKVLYLAGIDNTIDTAQRMGITTLQDRSRFGLALVLGGAEVRPLDITAAFGVFAADGMRIPVHAITKIVDRQGNVLYDARAVLARERVIDAEVARKINSILSDNKARIPAFGRNNPLVIPGRTVAVKTGTTQNYRDAWTVGYTPEIAVGVWTGNNDNRPMRSGAAGAYVAAPLWQAFMKRVLANRPNVSFADYKRVEIKTSMLGGAPGGQRYIVGENRIVDKAYVPKKKEEVRTVYHSILHYVDKDAPLSQQKINYNDPMYQRWETSLRAIVRKK